MLDNKDKILLENLFHGAKLTTKKLASKAGITQPAAYKRLKRLEQQKYISRYDAIINWQALPFIKIVYLCKNIDISAIRSNKSCFGLQETIGEYKYLVWCFFSNRKMQKDFEKLLPKGFSRIIIKNVHFSGASVFDIPVKMKLEEEVPFNKLTINEKDVRIMKCLSEGGARKTVNELSKEAGLPVDVVWQRKKRLEKNGYFMKFFAQPGNIELELIVTYIFIKTTKEIGNTQKRAVMTMKTSSGWVVGLITSSHTDYLNAIDSLFNQLQMDVRKTIILTIKNNLLLNRYPFEFLL